MADKGADGGELGKEGVSTRSSFRSLLPQSGSKDGASPSRSQARILRSRSASRPSSFIDSDSYVVVGKDQIMEGQSGELDSVGKSGSTAASTSSNRGEQQRDIAGQSSADGGVKAEDAAAEGTDGDSPVESDSAKDKEKKKETSRFFSPPKMRGTMFPFDQISVPMSSHRQKNTELHRIFSSLESSEKLIDDYSCALQRDILVHGRLFVTQNWLCFYANIFTWETLITIPFSSVTAITKERTAFVFPNAVQVTTTADKYGFSSLMSRDITYNVLFKVWQNSLLNEHLTPLELVKAARRVSGDMADVGTADELWGSDDCGTSAPVADSSQQPKATTSLPVVLPTHVEIMPSPENHAHFSRNTSEPLASADGSATVSDTHKPGRPVDTEGNIAADEASRSREQLSLPKLTRERAVNGDSETLDADGQATTSSTVPEASCNRPTSVTSATPMTPELVSMTGESLGSLSEEFETLSFADETGEIPCGCSEHVGRTIINDVYPADVETIFQLLFTDAEFFRDFLMARNTINIDIGEWQEQADGSKLRDLNYTVALNYSFGPKFSPTTEHQVYSCTAQPGLKHLVHTEVMNRNIPYADTFFVSCQYCVTRVAHDKTRLRITSNINFRKSCWGVVKNLIEKNAGDGVRSFYNHLDGFLKEHLASLPVHHRVKHRRRRQRHTSRLRHRKVVQAPQPPPPSSPTHPPTESPSPSLPSSPLSLQRPTHPSTTSLHSLQLNGSTHTEQPGTPVPLSAGPEDKRGSSSSSFPQVNMALTLLLGILIVSNMALYHYLMSYQPNSSTTTTNRPLPVDSLPDYLEWPTTNQEWIALTRRHLESHEAQRQQWLDTLSVLVSALDQAESALSLAKQMVTDQIQSTNKQYPHSHPPPPSSPSSPSAHKAQTETQIRSEKKHNLA